MGLSQITVTGTLLDEISQEPLSGVKVSSNLPDKVMTDANGFFTIQHAENDDILLFFDLDGDGSAVPGRLCAGSHSLAQQRTGPRAFLCYLDAGCGCS